MSSSVIFEFLHSSKTTNISTSFVIDAGGIGLFGFFSNRMFPVTVSITTALSQLTSGCSNGIS